MFFKKKDPDRKVAKDEPSEDDPIIELTDEVKIEPGEALEAKSSPTDEFIPPKADTDPLKGEDENLIVFEENENSSLEDDPFTEDDEIDFFTEEDELAEDDEIIAIPSEVSPTFGEENEELEMLTDLDFEHEEKKDIIPTAELDNDEIDTDDDIIEIIEFDRHYEDDEVIEQAGLSNRSAQEDGDFLDLFDANEKGPPEDGEMRELSESEEKAVEDEMRLFFDDVFQDNSEIEDNAAQLVEKFSESDRNLDLTTAAAALSSGAGSEDAASPSKDLSETDEHRQTDSLASNNGDTPVESYGQIDQAIERIINEKFAGRIEHIIYEIIEKAVQREIDRLKESLLEDRPHEDHR
ncbi:MAG: hypothetical protein PVF32_24520 [Desulfobacterales bacterium]|jgi:hypothetical protein